MADRLGPHDISRAATRLGVDEPTVRAVIDVEAAGSGFDDQGRPRVLFEKHYFHRELQARPDLLAVAVREGLARPHWVRDYGPVDVVWDEIKRACEISEDAALQSCSWGIGQVMGIYWDEATGYPTLQDMVQAMFQSEGAQLDLMVSYILHNNLGDALRARDWDTFAARYNGPGYKLHGYERRLAEAYARYGGR